MIFKLHLINIFFSVLDMSTNESIDPQNIHTNNGKLVFYVKNER